MVGLCETRACRRKYLLNYFGEDAPDYCGSCDNCLDKPTLQDSTIVAQKILSAVYRLNQSFGMNYVVDILKGSNSEKIREQHKKIISLRNRKRYATRRMVTLCKRVGPLWIPSK
jgi:ATP-dependent DNA helicase RecQ